MYSDWSAAAQAHIARVRPRRGLSRGLMIGVPAGLALWGAILAAVA